MTRTAENEMTAITLDRSVVEQVLEALEEADLLMEHRQNVELRRSALVTLRAALEQPLTDEQIEKICPSFDDPMRSEMWKIGFKAAHKIKDNT